jgi:hypothetical protein
MDEADPAVAIAMRYLVACARLGLAKDRATYNAQQVEAQLDRGDGTATLRGSLVVRRGVSQPLLADHENEAFFRTVVQREDGLLDMEPEQLLALRRYVLESEGGDFFRLFPVGETAIRRRAFELAEQEGYAWQLEYRQPAGRYEQIKMCPVLDDEGRQRYLDRARAELEEQPSSILNAP